MVNKSLSPRPRRLNLAVAVVAGVAVWAAPWGQTVSSGARAEENARIAEPVAEWRQGAAAFEGGRFAYCAAEADFDNGHSLIFARSRTGDLNIGMMVPGLKLEKGGNWTMTLTVNGKLKRELVADATGPDRLVIPAGRDDGLYDALIAGDTLTLRSPNDSVTYRLKGAGVALRDARRCVEQAVSGGKPPGPTKPAPTPTPTPGTTTKPLPSAGSKTPLPERIAALLDAAGLKGVEALPLDGIPVERRPADVAWKLGGVVGGIEERAAAKGATLETLSDAYLKSVRATCDMRFDVRSSPVESLALAAIRTASVECGAQRGLTHIALVFMLSKGGRFTALFHRGKSTEAKTADQARDALAATFRRAAKEN
ncbi:hypothetical protein WCLP8_640007 [uncultured Gammaproteobacteria bacterium]